MTSWRNLAHAVKSLREAMDARFLGEVFKKAWLTGAQMLRSKITYKLQTVPPSLQTRTNTQQVT